jgi:CHAT domain-containing protein
MANTLISQGVLLRKMGDQRRARQRFEHALSVCLTHFGEDHSLTNFARDNLASLLMDTGDLDSALPLYQKALESRKRTLGPTHPQVGATTYNLGILYGRLGDYDRAKAYYDAALTIFRERYGPSHPHTASLILAIGNLELKTGKVTDALENLERGLEIRAATLGEGNPQTAKAELVLAAALLKSGDSRTALDHATSAAARATQYVRETIPWLPERKALSLAANQIHPENLLIAGILATKGQERENWQRALWNTTLQRRGLVLTELANRHRRVLEHENDEARRARGALDAAGTRLSELWVKGPGQDPGEFQEALAAARSAKEQAEAELARVSMEFRIAHATEGYRFENLVRALTPSQVLVEIFQAIDDPFYWDNSDARHDYALVLQSDGANALIDLGTAEAIDSATKQWRAELKTSADAQARSWDRDAAMAELEEASQRLRRLVWDPIEAHLGDCETVFLVPEGAFHLIDFAALSRDDGGFLVEDGPRVQVLASARDLCRYASVDGSTRPGNRPILALGNVDYTRARSEPLSVFAMARGPSELAPQFRGRVSTCLGLGATNWPPLPGSAAEIEDLRDDYADDPAFVALTGSDASEEAFRALAPGRETLHVATHGFFLEEDCGDGADNPLLLSGLVLAGANQPSNEGATSDGILTAEEITTLDLRSVRLTVLSACNTGRGTIRVGEGIMGLRRAFAIAGVQSMILSLWPMPDEPARQWMAAFYDALHAGSSVPIAVREAKIVRLRALRAAGSPANPQYWSGFVSSGNWR